MKGAATDRWKMMTKGLTEYRAGRPAGAIDWLRRLRPKADGEHLDAAGFALTALAEYRLGHAREAQAALAGAQTILAAKMPDPAKQRYWGSDWHDWLHAQALCREAEVELKE
jgi:hypothetical protein